MVMRTIIIIIKNQPYPEISSIKHTSTVFQGNTFVSIKNKARITLAPFKSSFRASKLAYKVSAGPSTRAATQLIVTV